jgi:hypothetical protein
MSKWVMRTHFRHLWFNMFPMTQKTLWTDGFWPLKLRFENSGVHLGLPTLEFTWECEGSFLHILCILGIMWGDSWASLLARNLASPRLRLQHFSKLNFLLFYNGPLWLVLYKKSWYFDTPQTLAFFYQYGTIGVLFKEISWNAHLVPLHCLSTTFVTTIFVSNIL